MDRKEPPPAPSAPWSTGRVGEVDLTGKLFPWVDGPGDQPADRYSAYGRPEFLKMPETDAYYLPCFSEVSSLHRVMGELGITGYKVKQIQDGPEFLESIPRKWGDQDLHVILDPVPTERGTIRFQQIARE